MEASLNSVLKNYTATLNKLCVALWRPKTALLNSMYNLWFLAYLYSHANASSHATTNCGQHRRLIFFLQKCEKRGMLLYCLGGGGASYQSNSHLRAIVECRQSLIWTPFIALSHPRNISFARAALHSEVQHQAEQNRVRPMPWSRLFIVVMSQADQVFLCRTNCMGWKKASRRWAIIRMPINGQKSWQCAEPHLLHRHGLSDQTLQHTASRGTLQPRFF